MKTIEQILIIFFGSAVGVIFLASFVCFLFWCNEQWFRYQKWKHLNAVLKRWKIMLKELDDEKV